MSVTSSKLVERFVRTVSKLWIRHYYYYNNTSIELEKIVVPLIVGIPRSYFGMPRQSAPLELRPYWNFKLVHFKI